MPAHLLTAIQNALELLRNIPQAETACAVLRGACGIEEPEELNILDNLDFEESEIRELTLVD